MLAEMLGESARVDVVAATHRCTDDQLDIFALVEIGRLQWRGLGADCPNQDRRRERQFQATSHDECPTLEHRRLRQVCHDA
jgi:hypothetical protein